MKRNGRKKYLGPRVNQTEDILSVSEVSRLLNIPASTIYGLAQQGKIRAVKFGRHWRFLAKDIHNYLNGIGRISQAPDPANRRLFPRIKSEISARIEGDLAETGTVVHKGMIQNISEGGVYLLLEGMNGVLETGHPVKVHFEIRDAGSSKLELQGRIVRVAENKRTGIGIKFRYLSNEDQEVIRDYVG